MVFCPLQILVNTLCHIRYRVIIVINDTIMVNTANNKQLLSVLIT